MRKILIVMLLILIAAVGYLSYAHFSGGAIPTFGLPIGGEKAQIRQKTYQFFENIKFKNRVFTGLVQGDADQEQIYKYLRKTLGIEENLLDLTHVSIEKIELDSSKERARVKVKLSGQNITNKKPIEIQKLIFLYKNQKGDNWVIDINELQ
jgi:hypothetical protein